MDGFWYSYVWDEGGLVVAVVAILRGFSQGGEKDEWIDLSNTATV